MQTESREASWLASFAEVQLIFDKDSIFFGKIQRILREKIFGR